jgi:hypothetical protein
MPAKKDKPRLPKRGAVVAGGGAIDRLRPEDRTAVQAKAADFLRYIAWKKGQY